MCYLEEMTISLGKMSSSLSGLADVGVRLLVSLFDNAITSLLRGGCTTGNVAAAADMGQGMGLLAKSVLQIKFQNTPIHIEQSCSIKIL